MSRRSTEATSSTDVIESASSSASSTSTVLPSQSFGHKTSVGGQFATGATLLLFAFACVVLASYLAWSSLVEAPIETPPPSAASPKMDNETMDQDNATMENKTMSSFGPAHPGEGNTKMEYPNMSSLAPTPQGGGPLAKALLCCVGASESGNLPPDGLCDYTLGHHLYTPFHGGFLGRPNMEHLEFVEAAAKHIKTEYGHSFPVSRVTSILRDLDKEAAQASASYYWEKRFYHYGFADIGLGAGYKEIKNILTALRKVKELVASLEKRDDRRSYTVVAWNEKNTSLLPDAVEAMREMLMPDMIVVHGHLVLTHGYGTTRKSYGPNNIYVLEKDGHYVQTMGQAVDSIRKLRILKFPAALALSVSVSVYAYEVTDYKNLPTSASKLFLDCKYDRIEPYAAVNYFCHRPGSGLFRNVDYNSTYHFKFVYDEMYGTLQIWDTEGSLRAKLCSVKRNSTDIHYSLAVYSLQKDDYGNHCSYDNWFGAYSRSQMVRMLSDFFWERFHTPEHEADCLVLGEEF